MTIKTDAEPKYLDLLGASALTGGGLSVRTLRRFIAQGRLRAFRPGGPGGKILVRRADLDALVEGSRVQALDLDTLASEALAEIRGGRR